jgi:hypothetical protein
LASSSAAQASGQMPELLSLAKWRARFIGALYAKG